MDLDSNRRYGRGTYGVLHIALVVPLVALACAADVLPGRRAAPPRLAVVVVVDQMRADYLERFGHLFEGGLARLLSEGMRFTEAHQDHARTVTCPGHATIATGVVPGRNGIVGNDYFDRTEGRSVYCAEDEDAPLLGLPDAEGRSPLRLRREGLADWHRARYPDARIVSVAIKDRAAIMLGGREPDGAYWYHETPGGLVTSEYYASELPDWVRDFDAPGRVASYWSVGWDRIGPEAAYVDLTREDAWDVEGEGGPFTFPYVFEEMYPDGSADDPGPAFRDDFRHTPYADELVLQFARAAVEAEGMGTDDVPDLLLIGASAADYIGHRWGPYSHEVQDYYLRLDGYLSDLFDYLDERVGAENWSLVFTSDHGVAPAPEESVRRGETARRVPSSEHVAFLRGLLGEALNEIDPDPRPRLRWLAGAYILPPRPGGSLDLDEEVVRELRRAIERRLEQADYIDEALTADEVLEADLWDPGLAGLFRRSHDPERSPDVMMHIAPLYLVGSTPATHGSAHLYDTHVPLIFLGGGAEPGVHADRVRTVDVAPTLAEMLGVPVPGDLDGRALPLRP